VPSFLYVCAKAMPHPERHLRADDAVPAEEVGVPLVEVHGAPLAPGAAVLSAHELSEEVPAACKVGAVVAVGGDEGVSAGDVASMLTAMASWLLPIIEVAETADELGLVERVRPYLGAAHEGHVAEGKELARGGGGGAGRRVHDVGQRAPRSPQ